LNFADLNLSQSLINTLNKLNFTECTQIQELAIPQILESHDVSGLAQTGTGKTAAFLLPLMDRILRAQALAQATETDEAVIELNRKRAFLDWKPFHFILILVPTRELAEQVVENVQTLGKDSGITSVSIYGGTSYDKQKEGLKRGVQFVVATPGRLIDLYKEHFVDLKLVRALVFDEADRMFDMGFKEDMKYILQRVPNERQFLLFSATTNFDVMNTAYQFGANPVEINVSRDQAKAENVKDEIFHLGQEDKPAYILSLIRKYKPKQTIIFSNFKNQIETIVRFLNSNNIPAVGISSLLTQAQRNRVIEQFKSENDQNILVATDVAARGLDIKGVDMVINFELPNDAESYVHRIGRTGRAGESGLAFSFVSDKDVDSLGRVEEYLKEKVNVGWMDESEILKDFKPMPNESRGYRDGYGSGPSDGYGTSTGGGRSSSGGGRPHRRGDRSGDRGDHHRGGSRGGEGRDVRHSDVRGSGRNTEGRREGPRDRTDQQNRRGPQARTATASSQAAPIHKSNAAGINSNSGSKKVHSHSSSGGQHPHKRNAPAKPHHHQKERSHQHQTKNHSTTKPNKSVIQKIIDFFKF
jgi:ATP-dependent RNA helicase RhlB